MASRRLTVRGQVQGVGFRPFCWRLAQALKLKGWVRNTVAGVEIQLEGEAIEAFRQALLTQAPSHARIESLQLSFSESQGCPDFSIRESLVDESGSVAISPDIATCPECLTDVQAGRRQGYAMTSCSHCGPRFSIINTLPYDRANTSMAAFELCDECAREYADPADRRFHAQPIACPDCGPRINMAIAEAVEHIQSGRILAIKGLGGFHLACDARNAEAVAELRRRKQRARKPLALMASELDVIRRYAQVGEVEAAALTSPAAPVVLLDALANHELADNLAPGIHRLGFMLPYTALHHLLLQALDGPIVLTSANRSGEPQCIENDALLNELADKVLDHGRAIIQRLDDSVLRVVAGVPRLIRRARGYVPTPLRLPAGFETASSVLAMGAELKSSFCLLADGQALLSAPLGDLEDLSVWREQCASIERYQRLFRHRAEAIALDPHPDYLSSRHGRELAGQVGLPLVEVHHHHAHVAAVMAEHGLPLGQPPLLGIALDGLGLGADGELWGGEFLRVDYRSARRLAHIDSVPLPGGAQAMREPWRNAFAHLYQALGWEAARGLASAELLRGMIDGGINCPGASSTGRLFDAAAALLIEGLEKQDYEGEAAMRLEALAEPFFQVEAGSDYGHARAGSVITWAPLWRGLLADLDAAVEPGRIAARFHHSLIAALAAMAHEQARSEGLDTVVLAGGVLHNALLLEGLSAALRGNGLRVLAPADYPANDGGLALGQALVAAAIMTARAGDD